MNHSSVRGEAAKVEEPETDALPRRKKAWYEKGSGSFSTISIASMMILAGTVLGVRR